MLELISEQHMATQKIFTCMIISWLKCCYRAKLILILINNVLYLAGENAINFHR